MNALMISAMKAREKADRFGFDSRVSTFQLLLGQVARNAKKAVHRRKTLEQQQTLDKSVVQSYANSAIGLEEESDEENETSLDASEIGLFVIDQGRA